MLSKRTVSSPQKPRPARRRRRERAVDAATGLCCSHGAGAARSINGLSGGGSARRRWWQLAHALDSQEAGLEMGLPEAMLGTAATERRPPVVEPAPAATNREPRRIWWHSGPVKLLARGAGGLHGCSSQAAHAQDLLERHPPARAPRPQSGRRPTVPGPPAKVTAYPSGGLPAVRAESQCSIVPSSWGARRPHWSGTGAPPRRMARAWAACWKRAAAGGA